MKTIPKTLVKLNKRIENKQTTKTLQLPSLKAHIYQPGAGNLPYMSFVISMVTLVNNNYC